MSNSPSNLYVNSAPRRWAWKLEIVCYLAFARFLIKFVPFPIWRKIMGPVARHEKEAASAAIAAIDRERARLVGRYVREMARRMPFDAVCLPQAMAARWALSRRQMSSDLYIGAKAGEADEPVNLHAWLMVGEDCLTGNRERLEFSAFQNRKSQSE